MLLTFPRKGLVICSGSKGKLRYEFHMAVTFIPTCYSAGLAIGYRWLTSRVAVGANKSDNQIVLFFSLSGETRSPYAYEGFGVSIDWS